MVAKLDQPDVLTAALRHQGRTRVRIQGRSMYPVLRHGAQVAIEPVAYDELAIGDLVVFCDGRGVVCHRLLRKANRCCYLKGDTNTWADPPVAWTQILGRVTHVVEGDGSLCSIDHSEQKRQAARVARFSYLYALYFNLLHVLGHCRWWARLRETGEEDDRA